MAVDLKRRIGDYAAPLEIIRKKAIEVWKYPRHRSFTDHTPEGHSERIIGLLNVFCADLMKTKGKKLSKQEIFILLASVYLHDIGMQYGKNPELTLMDIRSKHHIFSEEMIVGSIKDPSKYRNLGVPEEYADEIAKVCRGHRRTDLYGEEFDRVNKGVSWIRLRLLAALLALADELDLTYKRVIIENFKLEPVPQDSRVHWWRCYYVEGVGLENGKVSIHFEFPSKDYEELIVPSMEDQIDRKLSELRNILWNNGVRLFMGDHKVEFSQTKKPMSRGDFDFLKREHGRKTVIRSTRTEREISDLVEKARSAAGLNTRSRRFIIDLDYYKGKPDVIQGTISYSAIVRNETNEAKELFQNGKVTNGHTTIPEPLKSVPPEDPKTIFDFEKLMIDGRIETFVKSIRYIDSKSKIKGVRRDVFCNTMIAPGNTVEIGYSEKVLLDKIDNVSRRIWSLSFGTVEIAVKHPNNILPEIIWYSRIITDLKTSQLRITPTHVVFMAEGKWMPGSGFLLTWKIK